MKINDTDYNILKSLEETLWRAETRFNYDYMDKVLAPDFFEFGRSGRTYTRADTLNISQPQEIKVTLPLKNFAITLLDNNIALVTYASEVMYEKMEISNRSSIWLKSEAGWQITFHQGTPTTH